MRLRIKPAWGHASCAVQYPAITLEIPIGLGGRIHARNAYIVLHWEVTGGQPNGDSNCSAVLGKGLGVRLPRGHWTAVL